ncbi:MFS transporter [Paenibacillus macquariensis subsp. defensor]|nr:MFS transporter [Paenibacillus macquariensis subsp. defensor]
MKRAFSFTAIVLGYFMALLDTTIINIALPEMTRHFGGTVSLISWVMNGYNLAFAVFILIASRLADQFGRKRVFLIGIILFTLASLFAGFSTNLGTLIALRVLQGLAGAIIVPITIPLTTTTFPKEMHGTIIGIWGAIAGLAAACGPSFGGIITEKLNWQWIFFVNVPLGLLSLVLTIFFIKESKDESAGKMIDYAGMFGITGAMFFITYALIKVKDYGWDSSFIFILFTSGLLFLLFFLLTQWKGKAPMLPLSLLRIKAFDGAALTLLFVGAALSNIAILTSFFLTKVMGMTELKAGLILSILAVGSIVSSAVSGPLSNKYGSRLFGAIGVTLIIISTYSLRGLDVHSTVVEVLSRLGVAGIGVGFTMAPVMSSAIRNVPEEKVGISSGVINMTKALGSVLGVAIIVTVLQQNITNQLESARIHAIQSVEQNAKFEPFVKDILKTTINASGNKEPSGSGGRSGTENIAVIISAQAEVTPVKLSAEQKPAFVASVKNQIQEAERLLTQVNNQIKQSLSKAYSNTFTFASYLLLPGILFALMSDRSRKMRVGVKLSPEVKEATGD